MSEFQRMPASFTPICANSARLTNSICLISVPKLYYLGEFHDDHFHPHEEPVKSRYNATYPLTQPTITPDGMRYRIGIISDLDEKSAVAGKSNLWASAFKRGYLTYDSQVP